jgi:hypothetical protein
MFTPSQIKERVRQQPFVPLRIITSSGEAYEVRHPDLIWVGTRDVHVGMPSAKDPAIVDSHGRIARVSLLHITAIEDVRTKAKAPKDGNGKKQS